MSPINFEYRKQLIAEIPDLLKCFQCGTCTAACQANKYGGAYSPRQKILAAQYGNKSIINEELWRCVTCNSCNERCPQEVNPYEILIKLKNIAYRDGSSSRFQIRNHNKGRYCGRFHSRHHCYPRYTCTSK